MVSAEPEKFYYDRVKGDCALIALSITKTEEKVHYQAFAGNHATEIKNFCFA